MTTGQRGTLEYALAAASMLPNKDATTEEDAALGWASNLF